LVKQWHDRWINWAIIAAFIIAGILLGAWSAWGGEVSDRTLKVGESVQLTDFDVPVEYNARRLTATQFPNGFSLTAWGGECVLLVGDIDKGMSDVYTFVTENGDFEWAGIAQSGREWSYPYLSQNLDFFPQPDGSYALYHAFKKWNHHYDDGTADIYAAGKFSHLYRPYCIDAEGTRFEMCIEVDDDSIRFCLQDWQVPVYPIWIDPTFGKTAVGGTSGLQNTYLEVSGYAYSGNDGAEVDSFGFYGGYSSAREYWYVWYSGSPPDSRQEVDSITGLYEAGAGSGTNAAHQWDLTNNSATVSDGTEYHLGVCSSGDLTVYYDAGSNGDSYYVDAGGAIPGASPTWADAPTYGSWLITYYAVTSGGSAPSASARSDMYRGGLYIGDLYR